MDSIFYVSLATIFLLFYICDSIDTITPTQFISDANNDTLLSSNGDFRLGFFSTDKTSPNRYLGIWFNKIPVKNIVWIANRDDPVMTKDGVFKINGDGNIMIFSNKNATVPLWSSNMSSDISITNPTAKLLDSGNFELTAVKGSDSRKRVWQSFDHPTDTLLPGMKLGLDKKTGLNKVLTSWLSNNDPGHGEYSMELETNGVPQFFLRQKNSESPLSRIGPWNGVTLSGTPILANRLRAGTQEYYKLASLFNFTYVDNDNEVCLILTVPDPGNFRTLVVEFQGTEQQSFWRSSSDKSNKTGEWAQFWYSPSDSCDIYMRCGKNTICNPSNSKDIDCTCLPGYEPNSDRDWTLNCKAKSEYQKLCGKGDGEGFVALVSMKLPDSRNANYIANVSLKECELECLKSCNCTGYASADIKEGGKGCYVWEGALNDVRKYPEDGQDFYLRVDSVQLAIFKKSNSTIRKKRIPSVVIVLIVVFGVFLVLTCCFYAFRKRTARKGQRQKQIFRQMILADSDVDAITDSTKANNFADSDNIDLTFFDLDIILKATDNFSPAKRLGQGSFGPVYKGELPNGHYVAVKRLSKTSCQGISEFKNEALLIAKLQHRNLVRLVGCCIDEGEKMLIYEYMPNKSLDYFIFDESKKSMLNWRKRHEIIVGIARGMLYLHQDSRLKIIHRDLKASNILLDIDLNPKISDFGTARIFGGNQVEENTNRVVGTFGYMSPEYALDGCFSVKSDVFSFGVLLLEIISGKKNNRFLKNIPKSSLIKHVWELWSNDKGLEMVDILILEDTISADEVMRCIQVGLLCVQDNAADRPTMSTVIFMLSNEATLPSPKQPMAAVYRENDKTDTTSNATRSSSVNGITVTELSAR